MVQKKRIYIISGLILLTLCFIWGNSLDTNQESEAKSRLALSVVQPILEIFLGEGNVTGHLVRKLAHFTEFGVLGVWAIWLAVELKRHIAEVVLFGVIVALTDETIQIFSARGSQVQDVWLDFAGFICGVIAMGILLHYHYRKGR